MHNAKGTQGLRLNSCVAVRKPEIIEASPKQRLKFAREHTLAQCKMVMLCDVSRLTPFQGDGCIRVRRGTNE